MALQIGNQMYNNQVDSFFSNGVKETHVTAQYVMISGTSQCRIKLCIRLNREFMRKGGNRAGSRNYVYHTIQYAYLYCLSNRSLRAIHINGQKKHATQWSRRTFCMLTKREIHNNCNKIIKKNTNKIYVFQKLCQMYFILKV